MQPQQIYPINQLSHDSDLLSLFHRHESLEEEPLNIGQDFGEEIKKNFFLSELNIIPGSLEKGYYSDLQINQKEVQRVQQRKPRQIFNKKEKKKSKKRTKMYIEMLENRVEQLQVEVEKLKKMHRINKQYIQRLNESEQMINGYFVGRQQVYQKLQTLLEEPENKQKELVEEIKSLRLRQGTFGKDRTKSVNYYFKEMVEMLLPEIQKYLFKSASEQSDMFNEEYVRTGEHSEEMETWRRTMLESFNLKTEVREYFFSIKGQILQEKKVFDNFLEKFYELKCQLTKQARKMEAIFDGVRALMTPEQIARCLCYVDKYRFEKKLSVEESVKGVFQKLHKQSIGYNPQNCLSEQ